MCDCGAEKVVAGTSLRRGASQSCGCKTREATKASNSTHGATAGRRPPRSYRAWIAAKNRCYYPKHHAFPHYGGRGIGMCERWRNDYPAFLADMGEPEDQTLELDRIENDKDYGPGNCRWATRREQMQNTSLTVHIEHEGRRLSLVEFAEVTGVGYSTLFRKMKAGLSPHEAVAAVNEWKARHPDHSSNRRRPRPL